MKTLTGMFVAWLGAGLLAASLSAAEPPAGGDVPKALSAEEQAKLNARIASTIKLFGDNDFTIREKASKDVVELGEAAREALTEAAKSKDAEVSNRASEALKALDRLAASKPKPIDPNCTDGFQVVCANVEQIQTFKATTGKIDALRLRVCRTISAPFADLKVSLRVAGDEKGEELAAGRLGVTWGEDGSKGLTRFYQWVTIELKAEKLEKGKLYELIFKSSAPKTSPWLINCFYRDAYADGELRTVRNGEAVPADPKRKYDLVFELLDGEAKTTSVPKDANLSKKEEHFGLAPDGTTLPKANDMVPTDDDIEVPMHGVIID